MKDHQNRSKPFRFIWRKSPVAKTIWVSYLIVLLMPLLLTVVLTTASVLRLRAQSARHVESISTELSRLLGACAEEIQANNSRILLTDATKQLALVNPDSFAPSDILRLRELQKQLPRAAVTSEYINAIYVSFQRSGALLSASGVYYDDHISHMLKDFLGLSLEDWKAFLTSVSGEKVSLIPGNSDPQGHILIAKRLASHGGHSDVVVVSEFKREKAIQLMEEFSENGELCQTLLGENGAFLTAGNEAAGSHEELLLPITVANKETGITLLTRTPKNRFLRQTMSLYWGFFSCALLFLISGGFLIRYFTRRQYSPIEHLNASLLSSMEQSSTGLSRAESPNEYDQMSAAVSTLLQRHASSRQENKQLREDLRSHLLQGILFGNIRKEEIILRHAENNGIHFAGSRFLVVLYAVEDLRREDPSSVLMQTAETLTRLDEIVRTAISRLADNDRT